MKRDPKKGLYGGLCYRTDCDRDTAIFYNSSTRQHYCASCAAKINRWSEHDHGVVLCMLAEDVRQENNESKPEKEMKMAKIGEQQYFQLKRIQYDATKLEEKRVTLDKLCVLDAVEGLLKLALEDFTSVEDTNLHMANVHQSWEKVKSQYDVIFTSPAASKTPATGVAKHDPNA